MILRSASIIPDSENYRVRLPNVPLNLSAPKIVSTNRLIGGGSSVEVYESSIVGEQRTARFTLEQKDYKKLKNIHESSTEEWLLMVQGQTFKTVVSILSAVPDRRIRDRYAVVVEFTITSKES